MESWSFDVFEIGFDHRATGPRGAERGLTLRITFRIRFATKQPVRFASLWSDIPASREDAWFFITSVILGYLTPLSSVLDEADDPTIKDKVLE